MSYKIIVKGTSSTEYHNPQRLDKIHCSDCFSEYISDADLLAKGIAGGYMHFEWNSHEKKLYTITEYIAKDKLTAAELDKLKKYTQGQWSDGIGEGFEQFPRYIDGEEVYLSPWHSGQAATITQEESDEPYDE